MNVVIGLQRYLTNGIPTDIFLGKLVVNLVPKTRTGSIQNKKCQSEYPVLKKAIKISVMGQFAMDSRLSTRKLPGEY